MEKNYKNCQSCGMPLKKSPNGGGTNADTLIKCIVHIAMKMVNLNNPTGR